MRSVIITEDPYLKDGTNKHYKDDKVTVDDKKAQQWIDAGWAMDPETGETGERVPGAAKLKVDNVKQTVK